MDKKTEIEAATFRRIVKHLQDNPDVQNIDLIIWLTFAGIVFQNGTHQNLPFKAKNWRMMMRES